MRSPADMIVMPLVAMALTIGAIGYGIGMAGRWMFRRITR